MPWRKQAHYLRQIDLQVMKTGMAINIEELSEIYGGAKRIYLSNKLPLYDDNDQIVGLLGIKIFTADMPIAKRKFNFRAVIEKVIDLFLPKAIEKSLILSCYIDARLPTFMIGDPMRLQRIIIELISNAINFTDEGGVNIAINVVTQQDRECITQIKVQDTGIGIPADQKEDVFLRFKRLTPSYKGLYKGTGLNGTTLRNNVRLTI